MTVRTDRQTQTNFNISSPALTSDLLDQCSSVQTQTHCDHSVLIDSIGIQCGSTCPELIGPETYSANEGANCEQVQQSVVAINRSERVFEHGNKRLDEFCTEESSGDFRIPNAHFEALDECQSKERPCKINDNSTIPTAPTTDNFVRDLFSFLDRNSPEKSSVSKIKSKAVISEYFVNLNEELFPFKQRTVSPTISELSSRSQGSPTPSSSSSSFPVSSPSDRSRVMTEMEIYQELYPEYDVTVEILYKTQCDVL